MHLIKPEGAKNRNYHMTRIRQLINEGELIEAKPEIYVKSGNQFINLGKIGTERLVTEKSVLEYIRIREEYIKELGKIPKPNKPVKAVFSDNSQLQFMSIDSACHFFNISRSRLMQSIKKNKAIEVNIIDERKTDFVVSEGIKTELVRFY